MRPKEPERATLVISLFTGQNRLFTKTLKRLEKRFGPIDFLSEPLEFTRTDYYEEEFGIGFVRKIVSFEDLIEMEALAGIKIFINGLEDELRRDGGRLINTKELRKRYAFKIGRGLRID